MKCLVVLMLTVVAPILALAQGRPIQFGVQIAPEGITYDEVVNTWKLIEELGYDTAWLNDHFIPNTGDKDTPQLEAWTVLAALATQTQTIRIGVLVSGNTYRHPALLAKMATTVDQISRGRLNLGIGAGWQENEHRAYGIPFFTAKERAERLAESLEVITRLWSVSHPTYRGKYYQLLEAPFSPKPIQRPHPPIIVGGQGKKWIMPIVARYADEWNASVGLSPGEVFERVQLLRTECRRINRAPCVRDVSVFLPLVNITDVPLAGPVTRLAARVLAGKKISKSVLAGSARDIQARIREYIDAGTTSIIITTRPALDHELMRRFATEVIPGLR